MNIFQRSNLNLDLFPGERAFLKALWSFCLAMPWVVVLALGEWFFLPGGINWQTVIGLFVILTLHSGSLGLSKFYTAQRETPVNETTIQTILNTVLKRLEGTLSPQEQVANTLHDMVIKRVENTLGLTMNPTAPTMIVPTPTQSTAPVQPILPTSTQDQPPPSVA